MVGMQQEEHVERFLEDGVGPVVLLAEVVHLVQEPEGREDGLALSLMCGYMGSQERTTRCSSSQLGE